MEKIGIFGGSFDPVHNEHISVVKNAIAELKLNKLIVVPAGQPPHKQSRHLSGGGDRLIMAKLAFKDIAKVEVSSYETAKKGKSFSFETVEYFAGIYPNAKLYFIVGADMLLDFPTWKNPDIIVKKAKLTAVKRGDIIKDQTIVGKRIKEKFAVEVKFLKYKGGRISSTKIRMLKMFARDISDYVPATIDEYISENNLYSAGTVVSSALKYLTPKRARHSALVAALALEKAKELKLDEDKIIIAAALHDISKHLDAEQIDGFKAPKDVPHSVVHQFSGAYMAEKFFNITDTQVLEAIKYHCSARADMNTLAKLIYVCDMIEDDRTFYAVEKLRELYQKDFEQCFRQCVKRSYMYLTKSVKKRDIYIETINAYNYYK